MLTQEQALEICKKYDRLKAERSNWENYWEWIAQYVVPNKADFLSKRMMGDTTRMNQIYDTTAPRAKRLLSRSIIGAILTGDFFGLRLRRNSPLSDNDDFSAWLQASANIMLDALKDSNFKVEAGQNIETGVGFGTAGLTVEGTSTDLMFDGLVFRDEHLKDFVFDEGADGTPDMIYRSVMMTPASAMKKYGDNSEVPEKVREDIKKRYDQTNSKKIEFIQAIEPIELYPEGKHTMTIGSGDKKQTRPKGFYYTTMIYKALKEPIGEGYEMDLPTIIWRWDKVTGDQYGWSEAMTAMPDIMTLNEIKRLELGATEKNILPPKEIAVGVLANGRFNRRPNGITRVNKVGQIQNIDEPYDMRLSTMKTDELQHSIKSCFHEQELVLPQRGNDTATEVRLRYELMQRLLGATFGRLQSEFLNPLINRIFRIMLEGGAFPELPDVEGLSASEIDVEYKSPLARSEKQGDVDATYELIAMTERLAQLELMQKQSGAEIPMAFDNYEALKIVESAKGAPAKLVKDSQTPLRARLRPIRRCAKRPWKSNDNTN